MISSFDSLFWSRFKPPHLPQLCEVCLLFDTRVKAQNTKFPCKSRCDQTWVISQAMEINGKNYRKCHRRRRDVETEWRNQTPKSRKHRDEFYALNEHSIFKDWVAEEEGFEPPELSPAQRFSRPPHSTALPLLRSEALFVTGCRGMQALP